MRLAIMLAAVAALLATPSIARACSCGGDAPVLWPETDATGVPINARIWVGNNWFYEYTQPRLRKAGEAVNLDFTVSTINTTNGPIVVYTPDDPLAPNTTYELAECTSETCEATNVRFTTGVGADLDPPPLPIEIDRHGDSGGSRRDSCGKYKSVDVVLDTEGLLVMQLDDGTLDPKTLSGTTSIVTLAHGVTVGRGACIMGWTSDDDTATVRYGAFDLAGNFSGWTEPDTLTIGGCSCRSAAPGAPATLLLGVAALALRRRRPR